MRSRLDPADWIIALSVLAVLVMVALVSNLEKALVSAVTFGVFAAVIQTKWDSRRDWRVWLILSVFACIHVAVIIAVRFPQFRAGMVAMPIALVDAFLMWGLINCIEKRFPLRR